jgi:predicted enzyme related to lactoylglutathione lyase
MNRVIHFEIQAADPERAATFYRKVFGWDINEWVIPGVQMEDENRYWLVTTGPDTEPGINGGLLFRRGPAPAEGQPVNAYVCTMGVADLDETVKRALNAGGIIALPRMAVQGIGWLAYCKDTEGNIFGMMQEDPNAKQG